MLNIVIFALWVLVGALNFIPKNIKITKWDYALVWIVLMCQLLKNILCGA